jgi:hypothetical protein
MGAVPRRANAESKPGASGSQPPRDGVDDREAETRAGRVEHHLQPGGGRLPPRSGRVSPVITATCPTGEAPVRGSRRPGVPCVAARTAGRASAEDSSTEAEHWATLGARVSASTSPTVPWRVRAWARLAARVVRPAARPSSPHTVTRDAVRPACGSSGRGRGRRQVAHAGECGEHGLRAAGLVDDGVHPRAATASGVLGRGEAHGETPPSGAAGRRDPVDCRGGRPTRPPPSRAGRPQPPAARRRRRSGARP